MAKFDFIPSTENVPAYLTDKNVVGAMPPKDVAGVPVLDSYGGAWLLKSNVIAGYVAIVASGGPNDDRNPIAVRQHVNPAYQGLRVIPGNQARYPLIETLFARSVGVGTRHRGAAVVVQVKAAGSYDIPTITL